MWDSEEEMTAELLAAGCIADIYWDEEAQDSMVTWDLNALAEKYPEIYEVVWQQHLANVGETLSDLVDSGYIDMSFEITDDGNLEPTYSLSDKGKEYVEDMIDNQEDS